MLINVLDLRERPYRWNDVLAVAENAAEDSIAEDADPIPQNSLAQIDYAEREGISVREAILWAEKLDGLVTLSIYDRDDEAVDA
jgi:hypothetical protein